jgi:hypothetical protein
MGAFWDWFMEGTGRSGSNQWPDVSEGKNKEWSVVEFLLGRRVSEKSVDAGSSSTGETWDEWGSQWQRGNFSGPTAGYWGDDGYWHDY